MTWLSDSTIERLRQAAEAPDLSGTRYRLEERIGRGGMGAVFLAEDVTLHRRVALKVLDMFDSGSDSGGELAARLLQEAQILARLEHPGIVPVHDAGTLADGRVFYAMKYVQGKGLDEHLPSVPSLPDRLRIFQKVCEAVAFAHAQGILHRDLKPENIMVGPFGEVLVMDWGVAKILCQPAESSSLPKAPADSPAGATGTAHGAIIGTCGYMSPEQARGEVEGLDERTDVYALGALLRFMLPGEPMPRALAAVCAKAMAPERQNRYGSVQNLSADVARFLDGLPLEAFPDNLVRKARRFLERHATAVILVLAYLVTRVLLLVFSRH
jgi:serine/threonine protein kinase